MPAFGSPLFFFGLSGFAPESGNFCERLKDRLIYQFKNKPNIEALLCVFADELQELQQAFEGLDASGGIDSSSGAQLDGIGDIVGVRRAGLTDQDYRSAIRTKIILNRGAGEPETLLTATKTLTDSTNAWLTEVFPGEVHILFDGLTILSDLYSNLLKNVSAGVDLYLTASYGERTFRVAPDPGEPPSAGDRGFSEPNYAPDAGKGGALTEVID